MHSIIRDVLFVAFGVGLAAAGYYVYTEFIPQEGLLVQFRIGKKEEPVAPPSAEAEVPRATADPRLDLATTMAYGDAEGAIPLDETIMDFSGRVAVLESNFPNNDISEIREAIMSVHRSSGYWPDMNFEVAVRLMLQEIPLTLGETMPAQPRIAGRLSDRSPSGPAAMRARSSAVDVRSVAMEINDRLEFEYFRPSMEAELAQARADHQLLALIQENLDAAKRRGAQENLLAAQRLLPKRNPVEQRLYGDFLRRLHRYDSRRRSWQRRFLGPDWWR